MSPGDLHDGVLQSLAGTALQLRSLLPVVRQDPEQAARRLAAIQEMLAGEQRELRALIGALRPKQQPAPADMRPSLAGELDELAARLGRQWEIAVRARLTPEDAPIEPAVARDFLWIVREAVANAVRHGKPENVTVAAEARPDALAVTIEDDGCGFPSAGCFDGVALAAQELGPRSLRERIEARRGRLVVESRPGRTRLEAVLPQSTGGRA